MKFQSIALMTLCLCSSISISAELPPIQMQEPEEIVVYNRILAKVNGKTISVIDVMKKMDLFIQKHYPQFAESKSACFQFYSSQWRQYLSQMIDQELMLADAEHLEVKVTDAEVREEILERFGPSIMVTLDKIGLTYEETRKMIHDELIVQKMTWFRINSKALASVNSVDVKEAYKQYCIDNPELEEWNYQVLSIRSPNPTIGETIAARAFELLKSETNIAAIPDQLKTSDEELTLHLSPELQADDKSISQPHREVLKTLTENSYSQPIAQVSRADNSIVHRIFYLKKHTKKAIPTFTKMADQLKDNLLQEAADRENSLYISKLRERFGYDEKQMTETLPSDFQPFALR